VADDLKNTIAEKLLDSFPTLLAVGGIALVLLGLAGGVAYNNFLPIPDTAGRLAAGVAGSILLTIGVALYLISQSKRSQRPDISKHGIKITTPHEQDEINTVDVRGIIKAPLPDGYSLRIFRIYLGSERMTPIGKATIDNAAGVWVAENCNAGGKTGDKRFIAAFLVGAAGVALIDYHNDAARVHRKTLDQLRAANGTEGDFLPALPVSQPDMFECYRVPIRVK
jgi:hypothetical protein